MSSLHSSHVTSFEKGGLHLTLILIHTERLALCLRLKKISSADFLFAISGLSRTSHSSGTRRQAESWNFLLKVMCHGNKVSLWGEVFVSPRSRSLSFSCSDLHATGSVTELLRTLGSRLSEPQNLLLRWSSPSPWGVTAAASFDSS